MRQVKFIVFILLMVLFASNLSHSATDNPGIPLAANPDGVAFNPRTDIAVVANEKSSSVSIVDLDTQEVAASIPVGESPRGVAIDETLNIALIGSYHDDIVTVIDLETYSVLADPSRHGPRRDSR